MTTTPHRMHPPKLGGLVPFSTVDFPGKLACVVFISGCPWRCRYCHNPHLQSRQREAGEPDWAATLTWLAGRQGLLDAVVFCGGEPLAERWLPQMLREVKALGLQTALHTGGAYPDRLARCLPLLDWVGFDIKAPFEHYENITQIPRSGVAARKSLTQIIESGVPFECRTTAHPELLSDADLLRLAATLAVQGVAHFVLQPFRAHGCADAGLLAKPTTAAYPSPATLQQLAKAFAHFSVRAH